MAAPRTPRDPSSPSPARHRLRRPSDTRSLVGEAPGGVRGAGSTGAGAEGLTPDRGAALPGLGSFGAQPRPSLLRGSPGAGQGRPHARHSPRPPRARTGPPGVASARGRRGRGRWRRRGPGAGGPGPHVSLAGGPMGARLLERSPYMDMFGGGRGRSHTPPSAHTALLPAALSSRPSPVSGPLASLPRLWPGYFPGLFLAARPAAPLRSPGRLAGWRAGGVGLGLQLRLGAGWGQGGARRSAQVLRGGTGGCRWPTVTLPWGPGWGSPRSSGVAEGSFLSWVGACADFGASLHRSQWKKKSPHSSLTMAPACAKLALLATTPLGPCSRPS